jgi:quercetin dioxygenase-like cupin family protein
MRSVQLRDLPAIDVAGCHWHRVRHALGVTAFGTNAYSADAGELLIEPHDEIGEGGAAGHEELYVVIAGRATFTVAGEKVDAPAGTLVLAQPDEHREATAAEDGTWALVIGGPPGAAGPVSPWEFAFAAAAEDDPVRRYERASEGLEAWPDHGGLHYNLGCYAALAGMPDKALEHLQVAIAADPKYREWAAKDADYDGVRAAVSAL